MSTSDNTSTNQRDVYATVTAQIINAIENGVSNWHMPWHTSGRFAFSPINVTSKKPYRGINTVCLWAAAEAKGYESGDGARISSGKTTRHKFAKARKLQRLSFGSS
jgi:antirestriction protein ArdC